MNKQEVIELMKRVKAHYHNFNDDDYVVNEWHKYLKSYSKDDVHKKFEQHLKGDFAQYEPKVSFLVSYLKTIEDKQNNKEIMVRCEICGQVINLNNFQRHHDRCSSVEYLNKMSIKYFNKEFNKEQLFEMSDEKFKEGYEKMLKLVLEKTNDPIEKKRIENYFFSKKGEIEFNPNLYKVVG